MVIAGIRDDARIIDLRAGGVVVRRYNQGDRCDRQMGIPVFGRFPCGHTLRQRIWRSAAQRNRACLGRAGAVVAGGMGILGGQAPFHDFRHARGIARQGEKMKLLRTVSLAAILVAATPAFAFDDQRQGFILGFGAGFHTIRENFYINGYNTGSQTKGGLATSFKIGAGVTDQVSLYYVRNASWFSAPYFDGFSTRDATYTVGISGIGTTYFLAPTAPSGYFLAAIGVGDIATPFEDARTDTGGAIMFGGGYEFRKNLMMEGTILSTNIPGNGTTLKSSSLQFTINYLFY